MNEERKPKGKRPPIGSSIPTQFQSFGSDNGNGEDDNEGLKRPAVQTSRPSTVPTAEYSSTETSSSPAVQASSSANTRKSKHPDWKQQTIYLPPALLKWLRIQAPLEEREISEIAVDALEYYRRSH